MSQKPISEADLIDKAARAAKEYTMEKLRELNAFRCSLKKEPMTQTQMEVIASGIQSRRKLDDRRQYIRINLPKKRKK